MELFICPCCGEKLHREEKCCKCTLGHSFDIAKEGYINLLTASKMNSKIPGDSKEMVEARHRFLEKGYYAKLCDALCTECRELVPCGKSVFIADFGCGEGYYTEKICESLTEKVSELYAVGVDISKSAVRIAAKRKGRGSYAVGSVYAMPIADGCADIALNIFSPLAEEELRRTVKAGGFFLYVVPSEKHLWEIKSTVYDAPYENKSVRVEYEGFELLKVVPLRYTVHLESKEDILALFGMTPYYWRSPKEGVERLAALSELDCSIGFDIHLFKRKAD